jgi:hypothetical protein
MEGFVATKLDEFDRGKISRRHLIEVLTLAATSAYAAADGARAEGSALKVALVHHISYSCPNFRQAGIGIRRSSTWSRWGSRIPK